MQDKPPTKDFAYLLAADLNDREDLRFHGPTEILRDANQQDVLRKEERFKDSCLGDQKIANGYLYWLYSGCPGCL